MLKVEVLGVCICVLWIGIVFECEGGVLEKMLLLFWMGFGGLMGDGW